MPVMRVVVIDASGAGKTSFAYVGRECARLGEWTGYYGKPGPVVMLRGRLELQAAERALTLLMPAHYV